MTDWTNVMDAIATGSRGMQGIAGNDGTAADVGAWHTGHAFAQGDRCYHAKTGYGQCVYRCKTGQGHTSEAANEPEVGASWADKWELFVGGGANGAGSGDVVGPVSSITNDDVGFADVSGKLLKSMGAFATRLVAALSALTGSTTPTDGDVDSLAVKESGGWKLKTADSFAKRKTMVTITAQAWRPSVTAGCGEPTNAELTTNKMNIASLAFGYAAKTYACFKMKFPLAYDSDVLDAYIEWHSTGTTSNGVRFGIEMACIGDNEALDAAWGTAVEITDTATGAANRNLITGKIASITPSGTLGPGETLEIRIYRDPTHGDDNLDEIVYVDDVTLLIGLNKHSEV